MKAIEASRRVPSIHWRSFLGLFIVAASKYAGLNAIPFNSHLAIEEFDHRLANANLHCPQ